VYYYIVENSEGANYFKINTQTGEISTKAIFDRETKAAYALEIEARDGAPSARPNSGGQPNSGDHSHTTLFFTGIGAGLPDFSWYNIPKRGKVPNDHKIYQNSLKYIN
jgi:hypothetical protein